jgi:hypothetical protein
MRISVLTTTIVLAGVSLPVSATDVTRGKQLVDANCYQCHDNAVYTRADRRVTTMPGLTKQVRRCEQSLGLKWFDDDIDNAAAYLNQQFYHFK